MAKRPSDHTDLEGDEAGSKKCKATSPKESTIRLMTRLAIEHSAVNLSQGFPNEGPQFEMVWAAIAAMLGGMPDAMAFVDGVTVEALLKPGESAVDLARMPLKELVSRAAHKADMFNQYSIPFGTAELRQAISQYTSRFYGFAPSPDTEITVCLGATEGFASSLRAICSPGDKVAFFQPFHELYTSQVAVFHFEPVFLHLSEDMVDGVWMFDRPAVEASLRSGGVKALLLNTPHNPTGKVFSEDELVFLCGICKAEGIVIITDEIYEHILYPPHKHICVATLPGMRESTVVIQSMSKTASATGWRVGWVLSPPHITPKIRAVHDSLVIQAPTPLQKGVERLLSLPDTYFKEKLPQGYMKKRDKLCGALKAVGFQVSVPQGAYYIFTQYRAVAALRLLEPMQAALFMLREIGVAPVPGHGFYGMGTDGNRYLRFAFCRSLETLEEAAGRLAKLGMYTADAAAAIAAKYDAA